MERAPSYVKSAKKIDDADDQDKTEGHSDRNLLGMAKS